VDTNHDVFLGEKSFATWHEARDNYDALPYTEASPDNAPGGKELFAQMSECMTAREERALANDTAEGFVRQIRAAGRFDGDVLLHHQLRFLFPKS
jgi:acyl-CoA thioesterase